MGMSGPGGPRRVMAEINVTPLVDVMLVLLIIFMVATPMITREQNREVDLNLPVTRDNPTVVDLNNTDRLILEIDERLTVRLGEVVITDCSAALGQTEATRFEPCFDEIETRLGQNPRLQQDETLYLLADTTIPYGFVVGALNRIRQAGVANVGMVTNPEYLQQ